MTIKYLFFASFQATALSLRYSVETNGCGAQSASQFASTWPASREPVIYTSTIPTITSDAPIQTDPAELETFTFTFTTTKYGSEYPTPIPTSLNIINVDVNAVFQFVPTQVNASPGATIRFNVQEGACDIAQSLAGAPCEWNGLAPNNSSNKVESAASTFYVEIQVKDWNPLWFSCQRQGQAPICNPDSMLVVNPSNEASQAYSSIKSFGAAGNNSGTNITRMLRSRNRKRASQVPLSM